MVRKGVGGFKNGRIDAVPGDRPRIPPTAQVRIVAGITRLLGDRSSSESPDGSGSDPRPGGLDLETSG